MSEQDYNPTEEVPKTSIPEDLRISLRGYLDEETANAVGNYVLDIARAMGRYYDLSILDGITVAYDYEKALAELDRGVDGLRPLEPSREHAFGVAMTPAVMRNGHVKAHVLIHGGILEAFRDENHPNYKDALYTVVHELAHVHDTAVKEKAFPGSILQKCMGDALDVYLFEISEGCWSEYAACRLSAFIHPEQVNKHQEVFCSILKKSKSEADREIRAYRIHGDTSHLMNSAVLHYRALMKYASYLIGHIHGLEKDLHDFAPEAFSSLAGSYFHDTFKELDKALQTM